MGTSLLPIFLLFIYQQGLTSKETDQMLHTRSLFGVLAAMILTLRLTTAEGPTPVERRINILSDTGCELQAENTAEWLDNGALYFVPVKESVDKWRRGVRKAYNSNELDLLPEGPAKWDVRLRLQGDDVIRHVRTYLHRFGILADSVLPSSRTTLTCSVHSIVQAYRSPKTIPPSSIFPPCLARITLIAVGLRRIKTRSGWCVETLQTLSLRVT